MKTAIHLPNPKDFFNVNIIDIQPSTNRLCFLKDAIRYYKASINMKAIQDIVQANMQIEVIDEEKYPEYEAKSKELKERYDSGQRKPPPFGEPALIAPIKTITVKGTWILYWTGIQRVIDVDFDEFQEHYFNYLTKQRLDID